MKRDNELAVGPGVYTRVCRGNSWAGIFLYRMAWLMPKAKVRLDDKNWYIQSRDQAMLYWGCSKKQYDKAMKFLRAEGLVEVRYLTGLGAGSGMHTTAFRVSDRALDRISFEDSQSRRMHAEEGDLVPKNKGEKTVAEVVSGTANCLDGGAVDWPHTEAVNCLDGGAVNIRRDSRSNERIDSLRGRSRAKKQGYVIGQESTRKELPERLKYYAVEEAFREARSKFVAENQGMFVGAEKMHKKWAEKGRESGAGNLFVRTLQTSAHASDMEFDPLEVIRVCVEQWSRFREFAFDGYHVKMGEKPTILSLAGAVEPAAHYYLRYAEEQKEASFKPKKKKVTLADLGFGLKNAKPAC